MGTFKFLTHREKLPVAILLRRYPSKREQVAIVESVIMCLETRLSNLAIWEASRDKRYSNREYLDAELALKLERELLSDITEGRATTKYLRGHVRRSWAGAEQRIAA